MKNNDLMTITAFGSMVALAPLAQGAVTWAAGAPGGSSGGSLDFDRMGSAGVNGDRFLDTGILASSVGGVRPVASAGDYTISMWINSDVTGENWFFGTGNQGLHLGIRTGGGATDSLSQGHWAADSDGTTTIAVNTWYHATFTYDADGGAGGTTGQQTIYLNGVQQSQANNIGPNNASTNIIIGARNNGNNTPFDGQIDDVAIWDSVIPAADIASVAGGTTANTLGAQAYWDFEDDQTGTTAANTGVGGLGAGTLTDIVATIPEPSSLALVLLSGLGLIRRKRA